MSSKVAISSAHHFERDCTEGETQELSWGREEREREDKTVRLSLSAGFEKAGTYQHELHVRVKIRRSKRGKAPDFARIVSNLFFIRLNALFLVFSFKTMPFNSLTNFVL